MTYNKKIDFLYNHFTSILDLEFDFKNKLNFVISQYFRNNKQLGSKDRKLLNILLYNYYRYSIYFNSMNDTSKFEIFLINFLMCKNVLILSDTFDYIINEFDIFVRENTDLLINCFKVFDHITENIEEVNKLSFTTIYKSEIDNLSSELYSILNTKAPVSLRSIYLENDTKSIENELKTLGIEFEKNELGLLDLNTLKNFDISLKSKNIDYEIQDNGSFLISRFVASLKANTILDACAGSGGKALAISYFDKTKSIDIYDKDSKRLSEFSNRSKGKHKNIRSLKKLDNNKFYDIVLIDAPCSGAGTIRRSPDKKYTITEAIIDEFSGLQTKVIHDYSKYVKDEGLLVYVTCSLFTKENIEVVNNFLNENRNFRPVEINDNFIDNYSLKISNFAKILIPIKYNGDIFFIAVLQKISEKKDKE